MTTHPRTTDALAAFDALVAAGQAWCTLLPDGWIQPAAQGRSSEETALLSVGLLAHHSRADARVHVDSGDVLFPATGSGPWGSGHARMAGRHALDRVETAARDALDALTAIPTLRAGLSFGVSFPKPSAKKRYATADLFRGTQPPVVLSVMGSHVSRSIDIRDGTGALWEPQRACLEPILDALAPFDQEPDTLWVAVPRKTMDTAQNGWHDGEAPTGLTEQYICPFHPEKVVGAFDGMIGTASQGHPWRFHGQDPRVVPASCAEQAATMAMLIQVLAHPWDTARWDDLRAAWLCAPVGPL